MTDHAATDATDATSSGREPTSAERTEALESLLVEHGLIAAGDVDRIVERYQNDVGPMVGARLVTRAWTDPAFRARLLADADQVLGDVGIGRHRPDHLEVVANEPGVHNVVVCTLCSCYPWDVLGLPPAWYKDPAYRSRMVREPRRVLAEMGIDLADDVEIRVWDSSSEVRYMVLPERPAGTDHLADEALLALVNRDCMIGVALPDVP